ncbi:beta-propeller fold lactonase family protein [Aquimarina sp. 2201CG5-10]|uniref:beta-propeller fold lactonase family protein n=1 Tax=Aquimarina callyspongiae TaxID=3098150 RepID=UPI002AB4335F|nr:beta-propeller fold lactonase family protein [Aquimarina sp. 2201CG5-10]MDY8137401.1 beta-propeller fold lactonase family protein [Aquimarina sp. 2201CG5-10]
MKTFKLNLFALLIIALVYSSCSDDDDTIITDGGNNFVGAVYAMTNGNGQVAGTNIQGPNTIITYGRNTDGTLTPIGPVATGGNGGDYDGGEGLDPLISAYALAKTDDNKNLLAVNAGSNTITSFNIQDDFSIVAAGSPQPTGAIGPNSIAYTSSNADGVKGIVYVSNITRAEFLAAGEPAQQGTVTGFWLLEDGTLSAIAGSTRNLANRPSAVQFSPDGNWLVVASINSGAAALASGSEDELVIYGVNADGTLSASQIDGVTSTLRGNTEGRNLPSAIGFQIVGNNYVVVTEAREFQPDGTPPAFPALQDGSVSTWQIQGDGSLTAISTDVRSGIGNTGRTACWLDFTADGNTFFVSNAIEAGLASYSFNNGTVTLLDQTAAQGTGTGGADNGPDAFASTDGWIDMWISDDGQFLYQLYGLDGTIGIYRVNGQNLEFIGEESGNLPDTNTQGIVAI